MRELNEESFCYALSLVTLFQSINLLKSIILFISNSIINTHEVKKLEMAVIHVLTPTAPGSGFPSVMLSLA